MIKSFVKQTNLLLLLLLLLLPFSLISSITITLLPSLDSLHVNGHFTFLGNEFAATDFGRQFHSLPSAVLHPNSVSDISATLTHVWQMGPTSGLTVAARGHGHSVHGQSQTLNGIVINMGSLRGKQPMLVIDDYAAPYVEVWAGELWIDVLNECLRHGLAPKSWTDYLYLTVGGTLSNAGISGQAFRHGPQINNVRQLEVVTGKGEVIVCSEGENSDLFHGVLGGLGQFGIITKARISLEPAPKMVKWIRVVYSDFSTFVQDQERLISLENTFDYIEGLVIVNRTDLMSNWRSSFDAEDPEQARKFVSNGKILFCLEMTMNFNPGEARKLDEEIKSLLSELSYIRSTMFATEVSYVEFLDRVHAAEVKLRPKGLWDVPHPWLNLLVPASKIRSFAEGVFGNMLTNTNNGPVLVYPVDKSKWDNRSSFVTPEEDVFYLVAFLPYATDDEVLRDLVSLNERILRFCESGRLGVKQYLPHYTTEEEWRAHFGPRWESFRRLKSEYDPLAILAPGQRIFQKPVSVL